MGDGGGVTRKTLWNTHDEDCNLLAYLLIVFFFQIYAGVKENNVVTCCTMCDWMELYIFNVASSVCVKFVYGIIFL